MNHVIRQILVQICQTVWILAQSLHKLQNEEFSLEYILQNGQCKFIFFIRCSVSSLWNAKSTQMMSNSMSFLAKGLSFFSLSLLPDIGHVADHQLQSFGIVSSRQRRELKCDISVLANGCANIPVSRIWSRPCLCVSRRTECKRMEHRPNPSYSIH